MTEMSPPSRAARVWGSSVVAPSKVLMLVDPQIGAPVDEDAFSGGEGGDWVWYPLAGSMPVASLPRWWRIAGTGAGAVGSLTRREGRARFLPTAFWKRRGVPDWERSVQDERADGSWLRLSFEDGDVVLRQRKRQ
jgi:hypothetical protein